MEKIELNKIKSTNKLNLLKTSLKRYLVEFLFTRERIIFSSFLKFDFTYIPLPITNSYLKDHIKENQLEENYMLKISFENSGFDRLELIDFLKCYLRSNTQKYLNISSAHINSKNEINLLSYLLNKKANITEFYASKLSFNNDLHNYLDELNLKSKLETSKDQCYLNKLFRGKNSVLSLVDFSYNFDLISISNILDTSLVMSNLKELNLKSCNLNLSHLNTIKEILSSESSNLINLNISSNMIKPEGIRIIAEGMKLNYKLQEIDISENSILNDGILNFCLALLVDNPNNKLKKLVSENNDIDDGEPFALLINSESCHLETLLIEERLNKKDLSPILQALANNKTIKEIYCLFQDLCKETYIDSLSNLIKSNNTIENLYIDGSFNRNDNIINSNQLKEAVEINSSLKILSLSNELPVDCIIEIIQGLRKNTTLEELDLSFNHNINNLCLQEAIEMLKINKTLKSFLICECNLTSSTNEFVEALANRLVLKNVDLSTDTIIDDCSKGLSKLFNAMTGNFIDDKNENSMIISETGQLLKNQIKTLNLYNSRLYELNVAMILGANINHNNTSLKYLELTNNDLGDKEIISICQSLETNFSLETLYLGSNSFGNKGVIAIGEMLKKNQTIKLLSIRDGNFTPEEIDPLFEGMIDNKGVEILAIPCSNPDSENIVTSNFHKMLLLNKHLKFFDFDNCMVSLEGVKLLADGLSKNTTLRKVKFSTKFTDEELNMNFMSYLKSALISNNGIEGIHFDDLYSLNNVLDLLEVLNNNKVIKSTVFTDTSSANTGILKLAEFIKTNNSLKTLEVDITWRKDELGQEFTEFSNSLLQNKYLENLYLNLCFEKSKKEGNKLRKKIKMLELDYSFRLANTQEFRYTKYFDWKRKFDKDYLN